MAAGNLNAMATYAQRPAWGLMARAATRARIAVPAGLGALVLLSLILRTRELGIGFWIDEGLSVGIADRPLGDIPDALRLDGSPPLYYLLLHVWMQVAGTSEEAARALSLACALLCVPVAWWAARALFGTRAGWMAAVLAATNPFLTEYAQEARMYALCALLALIACGAFGKAIMADASRARAAAVGGRPGGDAGGAAVHAQLGDLPLHGIRARVAVHAVAGEGAPRPAAHRRSGVRRRARCCTRRGSRRRSIRPPTPGRRGRSRRR